MTFEKSIEQLKDECYKKVAEIRKEYSDLIDEMIRTRQQQCQHDWKHAEYFDDRILKKCKICEDLRVRPL